MARSFLAKGVCSACGRPIARRAEGSGRIEVSCNVCHATTVLDLQEARARSRWSWPVVVAILGAFFVAGLALSLLVGEGPSDPLPAFPTSSPPATPGEGNLPPTTTPTAPVAAGRAVHVYVNDTTGAVHDVTISMWREGTERARAVANTSALGDGPHARFDPEASPFEIRVEGEAGGAVLVRAFEAPRCGADALEIELVIGDEGRFRWGIVGCAAISSR